MLIVPGIVFYMIPFVIALLRGHRSVTVFLVNVLLGWTVLGWFIALAISLGGARSRPVVVNVIQQNGEGQVVDLSRTKGRKTSPPLLRVMLALVLLGGLAAALGGCAGTQQRFDANVASNPMAACQKIATGANPAESAALVHYTLKDVYWAQSPVVSVAYDPSSASADGAGVLRCPATATLASGLQVYGAVQIFYPFTQMDYGIAKPQITWQTDVGRSEPLADQQNDARDSARQQLAALNGMSYRDVCLNQVGFDLWRGVTPYPTTISLQAQYQGCLGYYAKLETEAAQ
jgi:hypothetical protein